MSKGRFFQSKYGIPVRCDRLAVGDTIYAPDYKGGDSWQKITEIKEESDGLLSIKYGGTESLRKPDDEFYKQVNRRFYR